MDPTPILVAFLRGSIGQKRERIVGFASSPKSRNKFMDLLNHQLGSLFEPGCLVLSLPDIAWRQQAVCFRAPASFGLSVDSLRRAYQGPEQGVLAVTLDGRYGFWRDETYIDSTVLVCARLPRAMP